MNSSTWSINTTGISAAKRAGGRRRYNKNRQRMAIKRRYDLVQIIRESGLNHGWQSMAAEALGVSRSTICRDFRAIQLSWSKRAKAKREKQEREMEILRKALQSINEIE